METHVMIKLFGVNQSATRVVSRVSAAVAKKKCISCQCRCAANVMDQDVLDKQSNLVNSVIWRAVCFKINFTYWLPHQSILFAPNKWWFFELLLLL